MKKLATSLNKGLSRDESANRFAQSGANALLEKPPRSKWRMLLDQLTDLMIIVLIVAAVISGVIGEMKYSTPIRSRCLSWVFASPCPVWFFSVWSWRNY